ncbi:MAG: SMI1/KNR4 family protein [Bacteroidia bacterium]|nr:SMI1/KNR4 family protein [Bacteroidia bacterium]
MTPTEKLKSILSRQYISEDGDNYQVELMPGLTAPQINELSQKCPSGHIPDEIKELLEFTRGFEFSGLDEVTFDGIGEFGFEELFPNSVQLAGDGYGNFWIIDIDKKGNWGNVYYVCHDPAVVVKHSENLTQFIEHIDEFGKYGDQSNLNMIHEKVITNIWNNDNGFIDVETARKSDDSTLKEFSQTLPDNFFVADLRNKPIQSGFAWGKFGTTEGLIIRHETELIWGIEKPLKKGFLSKIFGR